MTTPEAKEKPARRRSRLAAAIERDGVLAVSRKLVRYLLSRASKYKSQKGQDRWVLSTLRNKRDGYFVDLAASDGITHSNTWVLEKSWGWAGIAIEPNPYFFPKMAARRSVTKYECAVDDKPGTVPFRVDNGGLGGIVADDTDNNPAVRGEQLKNAEVVEVPSRTLTELLDEAGAPATIDYLSLDVEGAEERVLRALDLDRYTFFCMTIERPNDAVNARLKDHGYRFVKSDNFDAFYIHESHPYADSIACREFESIPRKDR